MTLKGRNILIAVSGGIAAYKAAELVSLLKKQEASVRVIMTKAAAKFVTPVTFQSLTGFPARSELFLDWSENYIPHIANAQWADVIAVVPATGNIIGKIAHGIADDLVTTTIMAADVPVIIAPAMNTKMYNNPICQGNIKYLSNIGYHIIEPETGRLACGETGKGRLVDIRKIIACMENFLTEADLKGLKVLVTAGGTREPLDPVRYITNRSSGKTGYALAAAAVRRGARVKLISTPTCLSPPFGVETIWVETAREMLDACYNNFSQCDIIIKAAAVADFEPVCLAEDKIKKEDGLYNITLKQTPDILKELGKIKTRQYIVGFCAETRNLIANARKKLKKKNLDLIVANDITQGIFGSEHTSIFILDSRDTILEYNNINKMVAAERILDAIKERYKSGN